MITSLQLMCQSSDQKVTQHIQESKLAASWNKYSHQDHQVGFLLFYLVLIIKFTWLEIILHPYCKTLSVWQVDSVYRFISFSWIFLQTGHNKTEQFTPAVIDLHWAEFELWMTMVIVCPLLCPLQVMSIPDYIPSWLCPF